MKILVVDDEKLLVKGIKFNLENEGYQVECCYDGETAVQLARTGGYGLIILDLMMPGLDGLEKMKNLMASLRAKPPREIGGAVVMGMRDYQSGTVSVAELGVVGKTHISGSNVLYFELEDGTAFIIRPSGTEPKIKVYILAQGEDRADCEAKLARYTEFAESLKN